MTFQWNVKQTEDESCVVISTARNRPQVKFVKTTVVAFVLRELGGQRIHIDFWKGKITAINWSTYSTLKSIT